MSENEDVTILLIDDDESHADLAKINLERAGITNPIKHFTTGQKALDFLFQDTHGTYANKYLIILDINMPGLDGRQVLTQIKGNPRSRNIPVIMLTTTENEGEIDRCYALGCNIYITKPMAYEDFSQAIHELGLLIKKAKIPGAARLVA